MPLYEATAPAGVEIDVNPADGWQQLTVTTDINQADCDVVLHSGSRLVVVGRGRGLLVDKMQLDPEILKVTVLPSAGTITLTVTLSPSPS